MHKGRGTGIYSLAHVSRDVESTTNALELGESVNHRKVGVVGDLQVVVDLGEQGEADVGDLLVGNDGKGLANRSQVGGVEGLETVVVQTKRSVQGLEGRHLKGTNETEGHVGGPDEVGQGDLQSLVVIGEGHRVRDITKLHVDFVDITVVGNEDGVHLLDVDALEGADGGVLDVDLVGLGDLGGEADGLEVREGVPLDALDLLELGELNGVQAGETVKGHGAVDLLEAVGADALHVRVVAGDQVAIELLNAVERNVVGGAGSNGNGSGEGLAGSKGSGITGVLDGSGRRCGAAGLGCSNALAATRQSNWASKHTVNRASEGQSRQGVFHEGGHDG